MTMPAKTPSKEEIGMTDSLTEQIMKDAEEVRNWPSWIKESLQVKKEAAEQVGQSNG